MSLVLLRLSFSSSQRFHFSIWLSLYEYVMPKLLVNRIIYQFFEKWTIFRIFSIIRMPKGHMPWLFSLFPSLSAPYSLNTFNCSYELVGFYAVISWFFWILHIAVNHHCSTHIMYVQSSIALQSLVGSTALLTLMLNNLIKWRQGPVSAMARHLYIDPIPLDWSPLSLVCPW